MSKFTVSDEAKLAIRLLRTMLVLVRFDEVRHRRPTRSYVREVPSYIVEFYASLHGVGILWYRRVDNAELCMGGSAVSTLSLTFGDDSSYQNLCEFIGVTLGMMGLVKLGIKGVDVTMRSDSISALTWESTERYRGANVSNASMVFTMLCIMQRFVVKESVHISGTDNHKCNAVYRLHESANSIGDVMRRIGLGCSREVDLQSCQHVQHLLASCNLSISFKSESDFVDYWGGIRNALEGLVSEGQGWRE